MINFTAKWLPKCQTNKMPHGIQAHSVSTSLVAAVITVTVIVADT